MERLKEFEELHKLDNQKKGRKLPKAVPPAEKKFNPEETQEMLLGKSTDLGKSKRGLGQNNMKKGNSPHFNPLVQLQNSEFDVDIEYLTLADLLEIGIDHLEQAVENFDEINFDVFNFSSIMTDNSFSFMIHKIFQKYEFYKIYNI